MKQTLKSIPTDFEFWLIVAATIGAVANTEGKFKLISFGTLWIVAMAALVVSHIWRKHKLQKEKNVPFLIVVGKPKNEYRDTLNEVELAWMHYQLNVELIKKTFRLHQEDWTYYREQKLSSKPKEWHDTLIEIGEKFWSMAANLPGRKAYHFIMNGPASLALALGATIGSRNAFVFYHYMAGTGNSSYHKVVDFSDKNISEGTHRLKTRIAEFQYVQIFGVENISRNRSEVLVAIHLAGHNPIGDVEARSKETGLPMITIQSKFAGTIPLDADWIRLSQEVATVLLNLSGNANIQRMHLFLSMPIPIAFCVGAALGKFVRATVYNSYGRAGEYFEVFRLEEL
jgi:hypothetical protein